MTTTLHTAPHTTPPSAETAAHERAVTWLEDEFTGWTISTSTTGGWNQTSRTLWIARREGHHPQAELSPGRLHTRLEEYHARIAHRQPRED